MSHCLRFLSIKTRIVATVVLMTTVALGATSAYLSHRPFRLEQGFLNLALAAGVTLPAMAILLYSLLRRLLTPLDHLRDAMRQMLSGGEAPGHLPVIREDEIGRLIRQFNRFIEERKAGEERLRYLAHHDALTGLPNRSLLSTGFMQDVEKAGGMGAQVAVLYMNLDNFKTINDSLGHAAGDEVIKQVACRLRDCVEARHLVARLDGDEFLVILREVSDSAEIERISATVLENIGHPITFGGRDISTSTSIGIAVFPKDGGDFMSLCKKADTAMVQAKESGRNTYRFFDSDMNVDAVERLMLRSDMKRALERDEFVLHYQPQVDLETGKVVGAEALIRWHHAELGVLPPSAFISLAEDTGLVVPIGEWVLKEACRQAAAWRRMGFPDLVVAVNLSAAQFRRGNLERTVLDAMAEADLPPECLELELTESILIKDTDNVLQQVKRLKSLGIKLSIDDFGTGYSSLAYLKKFSVDKIKIDRSFIHDLATDPDDAAIVRAIIQIARSLNLRTIAEGVEDELTVEHLRLHHCNEVQGYYFSKPMPASKFTLLIDVISKSAAAEHSRPA